MKDQNAPTPAGDYSEAIDAFHKMWDAFPHLVLLLQKNRTIVASNRVAKKMGLVPGLKCYQWDGVDAIHRNCKGNAALESKTAMRSVANYRGRVLDSYWLPVGGESDLMIHFSIDITKYAKEELLQEPS